MKVCVVTCTGARWELFSLCRRWVERQTVKPDLWIVQTDTGEDVADLPAWATAQKCSPKPDGWSPTRNSGSASWSLHTALRSVPTDHAAIVMEDDDWYAPDHIERHMQMLRLGHLVSYARSAVRFHLPSSRWTGMNWKVEDAIEGCVGLHPDGILRYADSLAEKENWSPPDGIYEGFSSVGIKGVGHGLPGRAGATKKHQSHYHKTLRMLPDPGHKMFRMLLGADAESYIALLQ